MLSRIVRYILVIFLLVVFQAKSIAAPASCSSEDFKESLIFLNDYLMCIAGSENDCTTITDAVVKSSVMVAGATNFALSKYSADKLKSLSDIILKDPKKFARDSFYAKRIEAEWGGKEVDEFLKKKNGNYNAAIESLDKEIKSLDSSKMNPKALAEKKQILEDMKSKVELRKSLVAENNQVLKTAIKETKKINKAVLRKVSAVDEELSSLRSELSKKNFNPDEKVNLKNKIAELEKNKGKLLANFQSIDTKVQSLADIYNPELDKYISELKNKALSYPDQRNAIQETIKEIQKKRIKPHPSATGNISRLIINVDVNGYSVVDANGSFKMMPKWGQENRLSAIRDFPKILKTVLSEDPNILDKPAAFKEKLAYYEHERYRNYTQQKLINTYENRRKLMEITGEALPDIKLPVDKKGFAIPNSTISAPQREALARQIKTNWLEVDVPLEKLSGRNYERTVAQIVKELELNIPFWHEGKNISQVTKFFLPRPVLGKAVGTGLRLGSQWALTAVMAWFDFYDLRETLYGAAFQSEAIKERYWGLLETQCRMPKEQVIGAQNDPKEHSKWFCGCEEKEIKSEKLNKICRVPPSEMSADIKNYCQKAQSSGRDRDLEMAKMLSEDKFKNKEMKDIFKSAAGCEVMKNYPSHCRFTTTDVTDQGLYFMSLIRQNNLEKSVTEICPDVCQHWVEVANKKVEQIKSLQDVKNLPLEKSQNKAEKNCDSEFYLGSPPENFEKAKEWRRCQPPIICGRNGEVRVNINNKKRDLEYYELKFNPETKSINSVKHQRTQIQNKINNLGYTYLKTDTKPTFQYDFDQEGSLAKINVFDFGSDSKTVLMPEEILPKLNEYAYNANSRFLSGRNMEEFAVSKRIEIMLMSDKVINYCCKNELRCGDEETEESSDVRNQKTLMSK